ncbi:MAG: hypothetical protein WC295_08275 [Methanoregula sp.]|jgi:hypothetical protein
MTEYGITGRTAGEEGSSTYEGRHLSIVESELVHPYRSTGFVNKGDPVIHGANIVGVAFDTAEAATDKIAIDTEGIWYLYVLGSVSDGTTDGIAKALSYGDPIYIKRTPGTDTYILSGQQDPAAWQPFGFVLGAVSAHLTTPTLVAVKVHNDFVPEGGRLHFGSGYLAGSTTGNMLLEGDAALRKNRLMEACLAPATLLLAGEQIHGFNIRVVDNLVSTGGEITGGELKVVRDEATDATVSSMTALKLDCDNKNGGIAPYVRGLDIKMEGAPGATPAVRSAIHVGSSGTAGTLESLIELDAFTNCGGSASDTLTVPSGTIAVNVAGVIHFIQLYST